MRADEPTAKEYPMAQTITGTIGTLVSLALAAENPTTITGTGLLTAGLNGDASRAWEVVNAGTVSNAVLGGSGIRLLAGGTVTNTGAAGLISGDYAGIRISGAAGTVSNAGTVSGTDNGVYVYQGGSVTNLATGTITGRRAVYGGTGALAVDNAGIIAGGTAVSQSGVRLRTGGSVTNHSTGTISGHYGAHLQGSVGTVDNAGTILGGSGTVARAIRMTAGGTVANQASGLISGFIGIEANGTVASVANDGTIIGSLGTQGFGIGLEAGGVVTNTSGGTIIGRHAIYVGVYGAAASTIVNAGVIAGATTATGSGVRLDSAGTITNQAGGTISGYIGILSNVTATAVAVLNAGIIIGDTAGPSGYGIYIRGTGAVTNLAGGTITGRYGISARNKVSTVENAGRIDGGTGAGERGVFLGKGGTITNLAGGTITGNRGVVLTGGAGTLRNAGTISGANAAVSFGSGFDHTLIADVGAVFTGLVNGTNPIGGPNASTMVLASAAATGTISGLGSQFINFARMAVDAGATWVLSGANTLVDQTTLTNNGTVTAAGALKVDDLLGSGRIVTAGGNTITTTGTVAAGQTLELGAGTNVLALMAGTGFAGTIAGFGKGETITLTDVTDAVSAAIVGGNTLVVDRSGNPDLALILDPGTDYTGATFTVGDGAGDFITTDLACFAAGTRIDTPDGPVPVEALAVGQPVLTVSGRSVPVKWIGWRRLDLARHPDPARVRPIRVEPGAIAPNVPSLPVVLSPEHAVAIDGHLIPIRLLVNGMTIRSETACRTVTYYHVELDAHDVLLSEGLPVESYLDTGNRMMFENALGPLLLHPDPGANQDQRIARSCLPFLDAAEQVRPIWEALAERARGLGHAPPAIATTVDPALEIEMNGRRFAPTSVQGGVYTFFLPAFDAAPRLLSRSVCPHGLRPWISDRRRLGVSVRAITLRRAGQQEVLPLDHPGLRDGWWQPERDAAMMWRWTNGSALLPLSAGGPAVLEVRIGLPLAYAIAA